MVISFTPLIPPELVEGDVRKTEGSYLCQTLM